MTDNFWSVIHNQLNDLIMAENADDVIRILSWERNPYGHQRGSADGFFAGSGGDDTVWGALCDAGWKQVWAESALYYAMRAPDGSFITYIEGDVYRGDRRPTTQEG